MNRHRLTIPLPLPLIAGLIAVLTIVALPLPAQPADEAHTAKGIGPVYDAAHEITLEGTIQQVVATPEPGSPIGLHLLVNGSEGTFDAALGPYMTKQTRAALHDGDAVQIVGAIERVHGSEYLLVRQVTFSGRTLTVRNLNGALLLVQSARRPHRTTVYARQGEVNGGGR
jgi:hypothetical protein